MIHKFTTVRGTSRDTDSVGIEIYQDFGTADSQLICTGHLNNRTNTAHLTDDQYLTMEDRGLDEYEIIKQIENQKIEIV